MELVINDGELGMPDRVAIFNKDYNIMGCCETDNAIWDKSITILFG